MLSEYVVEVTPADATLQPWTRHAQLVDDDEARELAREESAQHKATVAVYDVRGACVTRYNSSGVDLELPFFTRIYSFCAHRIATKGFDNCLHK